MLNGKLSRFVAEFQRFRWVDGARLEAGRLSEAGVRGRRAVAALLCHDWAPDVHQRPGVIQAILQDAFLDAVNGLSREDLDRLGALMRAQIEEVG